MTRRGRGWITIVLAVTVLAVSGSIAPMLGPYLDGTAVSTARAAQNASNPGDAGSTPAETTNQSTTTGPRSVIELGDTVTVRNQTYAWEGNQRILIPAGLIGSAVGGPRTYGPLQWYLVSTKVGKLWIPHRDLLAGSGKAFHPGENVTVTQGDTGWQGSNEVSVPEGAYGTVVSKPHVYDKRRYYEVRTGSGDIWIPRGVLQEATDTLDQGDGATVERQARAWWAGDQITLHSGMGGTVSGGPTLYSDDRWYRLQTGIGPVWIRDGSLEAGRESAITSGRQVTITERTTAWEDGNRLFLDRGTTGTIAGSPAVYQEKLWYKLQTNTGDVWVALRVVEPGAKDLSPENSSTREFAHGDDVAVNQNSTVWYKDTRVTTEHKFHGEIYGGPQQYGGHNWYLVYTNEDDQTKNGRYWVRPTDIVKAIEYTEP
jgi:hypothetical protein